VKTLAEIAAQLQGYDPQALSAEGVGQRFLERLVDPVTQAEDVAIVDALGRVLAADVVSPISVPPHDNSAMDGFAFDGSQLAGRRRAAAGSGRHRAGRRKAWQGTVGAGQCLKIMTGAIMPAGLDTVVPQEFTRAAGDGRIEIPAGVLQPRRQPPRSRRGPDGRPARAAARRAPRPRRLRPARQPGPATVRVLRRLRVAYFSTGDEILSLGEPLREGAVYDSNRYTVRGLLQRLGCEVVDLGVVRDEPALLEQAFRDAAAKADADHHQRRRQRRRGRLHQGHDEAAGRRRVLEDRDAARAGRWRSAASAASVLFGLPGNPVAVMVTFLAFVRPALLRMMGCRDTAAAALRAQQPGGHAQEAGPHRVPARHRQHARADGSLQVRTTGNQGSGVLSSMVQANGLIVLHHAQGNVAAGDGVDVMMFEGVV
jgi:molybdopterin molybdotransferase